MAKVLVNESSLTGIADAIRGKNGSTDTYKPSEMAAAITAISGGGSGSGQDIPDSAFVLNGNCKYWDYNGKWDSFITAYADKWSTSNIIDSSYMFRGSKLTQIPFEINLGNYTILANMFNSSNITTLPTIIGNNIVIQSISGFLNYSKIKSIPNDYFNFISDIYGSFSNIDSMFKSCKYLRNFPTSVNILPMKSKVTNPYSSFYYSMCSDCLVLDEITNLAVNTTVTYTTNEFISTVNMCNRLKSFTFETGKIVNWKNQVIDLSDSVGYGIYDVDALNAGIINSKKVTDDATYQALKDDPDWYAFNMAYSRYNHDSAVATINSLPDTSAYLAADGGTNTIKFKGAAGSATDGGAISSLTTDEIAVATAKGWTVTLV